VCTEKPVLRQPIPRSICLIFVKETQAQFAHSTVYRQNLARALDNRLAILISTSGRQFRCPVY